VKNRFQNLPFKFNLHHYSPVEKRVAGAGAGYYSGTLGAKGGSSDVAVAANLAMDVQRSREVPQPVAARLSGVHGKGLAQITKLTVGAVQVESS
jgi:hypothetical protein